MLATSQRIGLANTLAGASGPYAGQRFSISTQEFWIGSSPNNHLCLNADPGVSGNHACIRREDRFIRIYDNGSLNNTIVNGRPIGKEVVLLQVGDRIRFGQSEFILGA
jgi:pSer/pThr/pTyr-binding forkhead associated (FHA) protein